MKIKQHLNIQLEEHKEKILKKNEHGPEASQDMSLESQKEKRYKKGQNNIWRNNV